MELIDYLEKIGLPDVLIEQQGHATTLFLRNGIYTLWEAIVAVHALPYGRTTDRGNFYQVLEEKRGTCSGKHALVAALAKELGIPLTLHIGIFLMTAENRPKIAPLLHKHQLNAIPEAHVYLKYEGCMLDLTHPDSAYFTCDEAIEEEYAIEPEQIGAFKEQKHQEFIRKWAQEAPFEKIWSAREEWIHHLSV